MDPHSFTPHTMCLYLWSNGSALMIKDKRCWEALVPEIDKLRERQCWMQLSLERELLEILWSAQSFVYIFYQSPGGSREAQGSSFTQMSRWQVRVESFMFSHKADGQIWFAFDCKENIIGLLHVLEHYCQPTVIGINSTSTGIPNLGCSKEWNFIQYK